MSDRVEKKERIVLDVPEKKEPKKEDNYKEVIDEKEIERKVKEYKNQLLKEVNVVIEEEKEKEKKMEFADMYILEREIIMILQQNFTQTVDFSPVLQESEKTPLQSLICFPDIRNQEPGINWWLHRSGCGIVSYI